MFLKRERKTVHIVKVIDNVFEKMAKVGYFLYMLFWGNGNMLIGLITVFINFRSYIFLRLPYLSVINVV